MRRDLTALAKEGLILRTYGGAAHVGLREPEPPSRNGAINTARKSSPSLAHVRDNDTPLLDGGPTTCALAQLLVERRGLHVITNNILALPALARLPEVNHTAWQRTAGLVPTRFFLAPMVLLQS